MALIFETIFGNFLTRFGGGGAAAAAAAAFFRCEEHVVEVRAEEEAPCGGGGASWGGGDRLGRRMQQHATQPQVGFALQRWPLAHATEEARLRGQGDRQPAPSLGRGGGQQRRRGGQSALGAHDGRHKLHTCQARSVVQRAFGDACGDQQLVVGRS